MKLWIGIVVLVVVIIILIAIIVSLNKRLRENKLQKMASHNENPREPEDIKAES